MQIFTEKSVKVQDTVIIKPTHIQESYIHSLSCLDQLNAYLPIYFPILYFFQSGAKSSSDSSKLVASLRRSLADALDFFPVLAGRLTKWNGGRLEIDVNGKGVEFSVATTEARLDEWEDLRFCDLTSQLVPQKPMLILEEMLLNVPLACAQVTTFKCGGVALSISFLHAVGDMQAFSEFVKAWARITRNPTSPISSPRLDTASLLRPRNPPTVDAPIDSLLQLFGGACTRNSKADEEKPITVKRTQEAILMAAAILRIGNEKVAQAVYEVETGPYSYGRASSFEALGGLLWVAITRARNLPTDTKTHFLIPVNMRRRWRPSLPPHFFGNASLPAMATARSGDLLNRHFSYAARLLHESTGAADFRYGRAAVDWLELQLQSYGRVRIGSSMISGHGLHASVMLGYPLYELDFGWGATVQVLLPAQVVPEFDGSVIMMPSPGEGKRRDLVVTLTMEHMKNLLADPFFSEYLHGERQMIKEIRCESTSW